MEKCTGYWEFCECEDCKLVATLYEDLAWYQDMEPENKEEIRELIKQIEDMGYSV